MDMEVWLVVAWTIGEEDEPPSITVCATKQIAQQEIKEYETEDEDEDWATGEEYRSCIVGPVAVKGVQAGGQ
jgi:hypothetical protein